MLLSRTFSLLTLAAALALGSAGCDTLECGNGTLEVDGACSVADTVVDPSSCGTGTKFDETEGACVPDVVCGENTVAEQNPDGSVRCVGQGGGTGNLGCDGPIPQCRQPSNDSTLATVCGNLLDIADNAQIVAPDAPGPTEAQVRCDQANPTADGPCSVQVRAFDPLLFAANPDGTPPLDVGEVVQDTCGRFAIIDIPVPFNGFLAVSTTNVFVSGDEGPTVAETYRQTGTTFGIDVGERRENVVGAVTSLAVDQGWTDTAGDPFGGISFADRGALLPVYTVNGTPVPGVAITANEAELPNLDWYFSDATAFSRTTIDPAATATGPNGAGIVTDSSLRAHAGVGNEPEGCEWSSDLAASIPNVVVFQIKLAHVEDDPTDNNCAVPSSLGLRR